jgi:UDP:flavonoid glycosyltransferase YjiC (YdhE family)
LFVKKDQWIEYMGLRILLTWELGGGLGHLGTLRPIAQTLLSRGHQVFLAARNIRTAIAAFSDSSICLLPAPVAERTARVTPPPVTFADILAAEGYGNWELLNAKTRVWSNLLDLIQPDRAICDYSPTAILALRCCGIPTTVVGTGFYSPPDFSPLPAFRTMPHQTEELKTTEQIVLASVNRVLSFHSSPQLERLSQLWNDVQLNALATFEELDHYQFRPGANYWGSWESLAGSSPHWPDHRGPNVYVYLKPSSARNMVLAELARLDVNLLVFAPESDSTEYPITERANLSVSSRPFDMSAVATTCDAAICHGGHGTTAALMLAGKPILFLPLWQEQQLIADNLTRRGAGLSTAITKPTIAADRLLAITSNSAYKDAAAMIAKKYANYRPQDSVERLVSAIETAPSTSARRAVNE